MELVRTEKAETRSRWGCPGQNFAKPEKIKKIIIIIIIIITISLFQSHKGVGSFCPVVLVSCLESTLPALQ
ncbi:hypothetical protein WISP_65499 [Willisornis vidua]|uniref:Uncharacterized protein n=1 Tax=Willisornis vidua TaxID=1566151 RepID=A0ABQ9DEQ9_9PASS|nr:hypothetical protein WISP_65499 [Willisornis vidua]